MAAGVVDHISWVQKVEPGFKPSKLAPFVYFSTAWFYLLKFHKLPDQEPGVQRPELIWYIPHSNHHRFPSMSDISLKPCCTVTIPFKTASFSSSYSTVYLCFGPNSSSCPSWISLADDPAWLVNHSSHVQPEGFQGRKLAKIYTDTASILIIKFLS